MIMLHKINYFGGDFLMAFFNKLAGYGSIDSSAGNKIKDYLIDGEEII